MRMLFILNRLVPSLVRKDHSLVLWCFAAGITLVLVTRPVVGQNDVRTAIDWPVATQPGRPVADISGTGMTLGNQLVRATWIVRDNHLQLSQFTDILSGESLDFGGISEFLLESPSMGKVEARDFTLLDKPEIVALSPDLKSPRISEQIPGKAIRATLVHTAAGVVIRWQAELRDGSNYIRQMFDISRRRNTAPDTLIRLVMLRLPTEYIPDNTIGTVPGSPYAIPGTHILAGVEQPGYLALADSANERVTELSMPTRMAFGPGDEYLVGTMIGCFPVEQRRRSFLYYIERERASRSRRYLHYNAWYDMGTDPTEAKLMAVAHSFEQELVSKRGVRLDGFVLDDGWDNPDVDLWSPDRTRFPDGFTTLEKYLDTTSGTHLGLWISPCGGYGGQEERLALAKKEGALPENAKTFDLGYPGYYSLFKSLCLNFMNQYGINYFKWDNAAPYENSGRTFGNLSSTSHFMRLCQIAEELHQVNPDLFINTTVGTWPSPFWLNYVDCTWRMGGADVSWIGKGDNRERGMNYRDGEVYTMVVKRAPLYPLNSMMFHGVVLGHEYQAKKTSEAGNNMTHEFRSYFALGTNLQELYLSPDLMNDKAWDDLAECVKWNVKHAEILVDSHWVSGDPNKSEPYCYASWRRNEGVVCLRNPDDRTRTITIDIAHAFELPEGAVKNYKLEAAYADQRIQQVDARGGIPLTVTLRPFEVLVFDALPQK